MKFRIVGVGIVGGALKHWFETKGGHEIVCDDTLKNIHEDFSGVDAIFLCLPVHTLPNLKQDLSIIKEGLFRYKASSCPFFVRSTVLPGTCDSLADLTGKTVVAMPEFLTEKQAHQDILSQNIIVGSEGMGSVSELVHFAFPGKEIIEMCNREAEASKYTHNSRGFVEVVFHNIIYEWCYKMGIDYKQVLRSYEITGFFGRSHATVPGHHGRGASGKCLPKDTFAMKGAMSEGMIPSNLIGGAIADNKAFRELQDFISTGTPVPQPPYPPDHPKASS